MVDYVNSLETTFSNGITTTMQEVVVFEQNYVQIIRKINLVTNLTDGKLLDTNTPRIYNLSATTQVSESSKTGTNIPDTTYRELVFDFQSLNAATTKFNALLGSNDYQIAFIGDPYRGGDFKVLNQDKFPSVPGNYDKTFFFIMARILSDKNKKDEFINYVIKGDLTTLKDPVNLKNKFEKIVNDLSDDYKSELKDEEKMFTKLKKSSDYKKLTEDFSYKP